MILYFVFKALGTREGEMIMITGTIMMNHRHVHQNHDSAHDLFVAINKMIRIMNKTVPFDSMKKKRKKNGNVFWTQNLFRVVI